MFLLSVFALLGRPPIFMNFMVLSKQEKGTYATHKRGEKPLQTSMLQREKFKQKIQICAGMLALSDNFPSFIEAAL